MATQVTQFEIGDVVILKSGGPRMTVLSVNDEEIYTNWFSDTNSPALSGSSFHADALKLVD